MVVYCSRSQPFLLFSFGKQDWSSLIVLLFCLTKLTARLMTSLSTALFIDVDKQKAVRAQLEQIRDRNDKIRMLWQFFYQLLD